MAMIEKRAQVPGLEVRTGEQVDVVVRFGNREIMEDFFGWLSNSGEQDWWESRGATGEEPGFVEIDTSFLGRRFVQIPPPNEAPAEAAASERPQRYPEAGALQLGRKGNR